MVLVTEGSNAIALDTVREFLRVNLHSNKVLGDACNLPFMNETFTTVVATEISEHLPHPHEAVREIRRVLKNNGRAIISVPDRYNFFSQVEHIQYFTKRKILYLFKDLDQCL